MIKEKINREYIVSYAMQHHRYSDKYLIGNIKFEKNLKANIITSITLGQVTNDKSDIATAKDFLIKLKASKIYHDINYIFTSLPVTHKRSGVRYVNAYNLEDETELIDIYTRYQSIIKNGKNRTVKINKNLSLGRGIYLDDGVKPPRYRFDYNEIDILTIAIAMGIKAVLKSEGRNVLASLLDNETKEKNIFSYGVFTSSEPPKNML